MIDKITTGSDISMSQGVFLIVVTCNTDSATAYGETWPLESCWVGASYKSTKNLNLNKKETNNIKSGYLGAFAGDFKCNN